MKKMMTYGNTASITLPVSLIQKFWHTLGLFGGGVFMSRNGTSHHTPYFFKKPKIIFTTLLATVLFLGGGFVLFGGHFTLLNPINGLTLNIAITGLIFLYLSLLALLPFSWKRMKDSMNDKTYEQDNQRNSQ